jgi:type I restriction enzyme S subunit
MANINAQELQEIKILVPPISLQNKYAELTEAIKRKSVPLSKALAQSQELMNSLTQRAFRGEL